MARYDRYIEGNTVRYAIPAPELEPQKSPRELAEERRQENRRKAARKNRERAGVFHLGHVAYLAGCAMAICLCAAVMIHTKASITSANQRINALEEQIVTLKSDNDAYYKQIMASVDLTYVKEYAINELGMTYAGEDRVNYYTVEKSNYMDQYEDIPQ